MDQQRKFDAVERRWYVKTGFGPFARWTVDPCNTEEKQCWACKRVLGFDAFTKNRAKRDGMSDDCRACRAVRKAVYERTHRKPLNAAKARWRADNPEAFRAQKRGEYQRLKRRRQACMSAHGYQRLSVNVHA